MARKLRIPYEDALYHVINRGNYRDDIYATEGAAQSFLSTVIEAVQRYGWRLHAFVIMQNHYHLAIETPQANLVEGMHWLQSTAAIRFNRFRKEQGHVFQGRYKAILVEGMAALCRVVDYIHLNPVRAGAVTAEQVGRYRWSSLKMLIERKRRKGMVCGEWLEARGGWKDDADGITAYHEYLKGVGADEKRQKEEGLVELSRGWAIGTQGWKVAVAREYSHAALAQGMGKQEIAQIREAHWLKLMEMEMKKAGKRPEEFGKGQLCPKWKLEVAQAMQTAGGVPIRWLAERLSMGNPNALRSRLSQYRHEKRKNN
jgi:REP element-mobilizing transposase RayT